MKLKITSPTKGMLNRLLSFGKSKMLLAGFALALTSHFASAQTTATIAVGTAVAPTHHSGPIYRSSATSGYYFSRYSYLYTAADMAAAGIPSGATITKVAWNKTNAGASTVNGTFQIYMKNSTQAAYTADAPWATVTAGSTQVYNNASQNIPAATGWLTLTLATPFVYNGGSLEIAADWNNNATSGSVSTAAYSWAVSSIPSRILGYANFEDIAATPLSTSSNSIGAITNTRPDIQLTYTATACSGMPAAGVAVASPATVCPGMAATLSITGGAMGSGLTYLWEESDDNGVTDAWAPTVGGSGGTLASYTTPANLPNSKWYRLTTTCSGQSATSGAVKVTVSTGAISTFPHTENFDNVTMPAIPCGWTITDANNDNYSWGIDNTVGNSAPNAMFYIYNDADNTIGGDDWLFTPALTLDPTKQYKVTFSYEVGANTAGAAYPEAMEIRWGNAATVAAMLPANTIYDNTNMTATTFIQASSLGFTPGSAGTYHIGFHVKSAPDQFYLLLDDVQITELAACTGTPVAGTTPATLTSCQGSAVKITAMGTTAGSGIVYQWEESDDNGVADAWAPAVGGSGAATPEYTTPATLAANRYYRLKVTCSGTTTATTSSTQILISTGTITAFPALQNFDNVTAPAIPCGWTITDSNNDGFTWDIDNTAGNSAPNAMFYIYNDVDNTIGGDDWLFTPPMTLNAAKQYNVTFNYEVGASTTGTPYPEAMEIRFGNAPTVAAMTPANTIYDNSNLIATTYAAGTSSTFVPATSGTYYIGFHVKSAPDQFYLLLDDVNVVESNIIGIANEIAGLVSVYPNPTKGKLNIAVRNAKTNNIAVEVVNTLGQQVYKTTAKDNQANLIDLNELSAGIYFVKININNKVGTYRISVQK